MKKEAALIIIKPDAIVKGLLGHILTKFANETNLEIIAMKAANVSKPVAEEHYQHIKGTPYFKDTISFFSGEMHNVRQLYFMIYYGDNTIKKCRNIAGATNPEKAGYRTLRGAYGRITTEGVFENVLHVSSDKKEAEREIKLWFTPDDVSRNLYPTTIKKIGDERKRVWK